MVYLFLVSAPKTDPPSLLCQDRMAKDSDATEANEWRLMVASKRIWLSGSLKLLSCFPLDVMESVWCKGLFPRDTGR